MFVLLTVFYIHVVFLVMCTTVLIYTPVYIIKFSYVYVWKGGKEFKAPELTDPAMKKYYYPFCSFLKSQDYVWNNKKEYGYLYPRKKKYKIIMYLLLRTHHYGIYLAFNVLYTVLFTVKNTRLELSKKILLPRIALLVSLVFMLIFYRYTLGQLGVSLLALRLGYDEASCLFDQPQSRKLVFIVDSLD